MEHEQDSKDLGKPETDVSAVQAPRQIAQPLHSTTTDDTCPWCGYHFQELYFQFDSDNAAFECSHCDMPITGYRDITFHLHPDIEAVKRDDAVKGS